MEPQGNALAAAPHLALPARAPRTLPEALRAHAATRPDARALVARGADDATQRLSYFELDLLTDRVALGLMREGLSRGDRVALLTRNTVAAETVTAYYATHKAGAVSVPINARFVGPEICAVLVKCAARFLIGEAELLTPILDDLRELPQLERIISIGGGSAEGVVDWKRLDEAGGVGAEALPDVHSSDYADWLFTSGTTGTPKCVMTTHGGCVATGMIMRSAFGLVAGDVLQTPFPFYTSSGCHSSALSALLAGAAYVVDPEVDVGAILERVEREGSTVFGSVPAVLTYMLESGLLARADLAKVRVLFSGGAAMPGTIVERLLDAFHNAELTNVYGLTEAGNAGLCLAGRYALVKAGSIGREPMPWTEFKVVDSHDAEVGPGGVGEIVLRGPSMMDGYFRDPDATAEALRDGWLRTGDLVRLDDDGFLYMHDRKKDVIIRGGFNVASLEVEHVLVSHPQVLEAAVVAKPHPRLGEDVCAFIVPLAAGEMDIGLLAEFCRARLADFKIPREFIVLDELPKNATGKVLKATLRKQVAAAGPAGAG